MHTPILYRPSQIVNPPETEISRHLWYLQGENIYYQ